MRKYLQLTRAHTAPLEAIPAIIGAVLATGELAHTDVLVWGVFGVLYHLAGYGMNSYTDWKRGYDVDDPNKQHHPLNTGDITSRQAGVLVSLLMIGAVFYATLAAVNSPLALIAIFISVIAGVVYNGFGKLTRYKFIFISIAHTGVLVVPYLALGGDLYWGVFLAAVGYMFTWIVYQIAVSGEVKDMEVDEENFLISLGSRAGMGHVDFSKKAIYFSYTVKLSSVFFSFFILISVGGGASSWVMTTIFATLSLYYSEMLTRSGEYERESRVRHMSIIEMCMVYMLIWAVVPIISLQQASMLTVMCAAWVIVFNSIEWGTILSPKV